MIVSYQLVIDCASPGFACWDDFYRCIGVPEDELGTGDDRIVDLRTSAEGVDHSAVAMSDPEGNEFDIF